MIAVMQSGKNVIMRHLGINHRVSIGWQHGVISMQISILSTSHQRAWRQISSPSLLPVNELARPSRHINVGDSSALPDLSVKKEDPTITGASDAHVIVTVKGNVATALPAGISLRRKAPSAASTATRPLHDNLHETVRGDSPIRPHIHNPDIQRLVQDVRGADPVVFHYPKRRLTECCAGPRSAMSTNQPWTHNCDLLCVTADMDVEKTLSFPL